MTTLMVSPPWDDGQVASANDYQVSGAFHPFTCGLCRDCFGIRFPCPVCNGHGACQHCCSTGTVIDEHLLVATPHGWTCPTCDYTQDWAWEWMLNNVWRRSAAGLASLGFKDLA